MLRGRGSRGDELGFVVSRAWLAHTRFNILTFSLLCRSVFMTDFAIQVSCTGVQSTLTSGLGRCSLTCPPGLRAPSVSGLLMARPSPNAESLLSPLSGLR